MGIGILTYFTKSLLDDKIYFMQLLI